jgi:two-component system response regulator MprA
MGLKDNLILNTDRGNTSISTQRVMIVDDDYNLSRLVKTTLKMGGFEVATFSSGIEALQHLENEHYDAVILDLRMPGMDGRTFYRELRSRGISAPVLIASAYGARSAQQELGAEAAIEKPFDPEKLLDVVLQIVK